MLVLRSFLLAAGIALSLAKSVLVNYSRLPDDAPRARLLAVLGEDALRIADYGE